MGLLELIVIILVLAWALGMGTLGVMAGGGLIHLLLVVAVIVVIYKLATGQRL